MKVTKNISYILQFIDSTRFMTSSLSNLVNYISEGIHRIKCKFGQDDKKCETYGIKYKYCNCFLEYTNFKDDLIEYKCLCGSKSYQRKPDEKLKKQLFNTYKFLTTITISVFYCCEKVFILMNIRMIGKNSMKLEKEDFYSHVNMEDITDADSVQAKRICKDVEVKNLGEYHDLYVQSDA